MGHTASLQARNLFMKRNRPNPPREKSMHEREGGADPTHLLPRRVVALLLGRARARRGGGLEPREPIAHRLGPRGGERRGALDRRRVYRDVRVAVVERGHLARRDVDRHRGAARRGEAVLRLGEAGRRAHDHVAVPRDREGEGLVGCNVVGDLHLDDGQRVALAWAPGVETHGDPAAVQHVDRAGGVVDLHRGVGKRLHARG
jgi:hypothetical protein